MVKMHAHPLFSGGRASLSYHIFNGYQAYFVNNIFCVYFDHIFGFWEASLAEIALMIILPFIFIMQRRCKDVLFCLLGGLIVHIFLFCHFF